MPPSDELVRELTELYFSYGNTPYAIGELVTQLQHALQAAELAACQSASEGVAKTEFVMACLLHDIGHLVGDRDGLPRMGSSEGRVDLGIAYHELVGAQWLRQRGVNERVCHLVLNHTVAKRYLCTVKPGYFQRLSAASQATLTQYQGGLMSADEVRSFEADPEFRTMVAVRHTDDAAKEVEVGPPTSDLALRWRHFMRFISAVCGHLPQ